jgi:hypothetical protein
METFNPPDLYSLLYCSHSTQAMGSNELARIIDSAERNNPQMDITGLLVHGGDMFLQWLEGPRYQVRELLEKIQHDARHECVLELQAFSGVPERLYPDWSMELVKPQEIRGVLTDSARRANNPKHARAIEMLQQLLDTGQLKPLVKN